MYYLAAIVVFGFIFLVAPRSNTTPAGPFLVTVTVK